MGLTQNTSVEDNTKYTTVEDTTDDTNVEDNTDVTSVEKNTEDTIDYNIENTTVEDIKKEQTV